MASASLPKNWPNSLKTSSFAFTEELRPSTKTRFDFLLEIWFIRTWSFYFWLLLDVILPYKNSWNFYSTQIISTHCQSIYLYLCHKQTLQPFCHMAKHQKLPGGFASIHRFICKVFKPRMLVRLIETWLLLTEQTSQVRSRVFNLKDKKNRELRDNVLCGVITPERIASMTSEEMASEEVIKTSVTFKEW